MAGVGATAAGLFINGYSARRRIRLPATNRNSTLTGFVLYIDETLPGLRTVANGGLVQNTSGHDIRFETLGGTKLAAERALYNPVTGQLQAWVRIPSWTLTQYLDLYIYYGAEVGADEFDPVATWSGYMVVLDCRTGADRSGNGRSFTPTSVGTGTLVGDAGVFDGSSSFLKRLDGGGLSWLYALSAMTVSVSVKSEVVGQQRGIIVQAPDGGSADSNATLMLKYVEWPFSNGNIMFQWRTANGSNFVVSSAGKQATFHERLHATWSEGEVPKLYVDGVLETVPVASGANAGLSITPSGDMWIGRSTAPTDTTRGWFGLIDELRIYPSAFSAHRCEIEAWNLWQPKLFYGIGDVELPGEVNLSPVAVPDIYLRTLPGPWDLAVLDNDHDPEGDILSVTAAGPVTPSGTATVVGQQVRLSVGSAGEYQLPYTVTDGDKASIGRVWAQVAASGGGGGGGTEWAGPQTGLAWYSGSYTGGATQLATLRGSEHDLVQNFMNNGTWQTWGNSGLSMAQGAGFWLRKINGTRRSKAHCMAVRVFATGTNTGTRSSWPSSPSGIGMNDYISMRFPVGFGTTSDPTQQKALAVETIKRAGEGWFDGVWATAITNMRNAWRAELKRFISSTDPGLTDAEVDEIRVILRPFWESNGAWAWGASHNIYNMSFTCTDGGTTQDGYVRAMFARFNAVARANWPGVHLSFNPLRGGEQSGSIEDYINPLDWDSIGPDPYDRDVSPFPPNAGSGSANNLSEADQLTRWNAYTAQTKNGGPMGPGAWANSVLTWRTVGAGGRAANPNLRFCIGEWGVWPQREPWGIGSGGSSPQGANDNPTYITKMGELFASMAAQNAMAWEVYFNCWTCAGDNGGHHLGVPGSSPTVRYPNASAAYQASFG